MHNTNSTKAQVFVSIFNDIHEDVRAQKVLLLIYRQGLTSEWLQGETRLIVKDLENGTNLTSELDRLLEKFQILGQLLELRVISKKNLATLAYEIIATGRNEHVQRYLDYLDNEYTELVEVEHKHFMFFKKLYIHLESNKDLRKRFHAKVRKSQNS